MKTWVLPFRRRNGFEWTMRSRSRWKGVRSEHSSGSGRAHSGKKAHMSNVFVRRIALAAVALPLLLGSCADDPPVPQMPETSSPTSEPTETESTSAPEP